MVSIQEAECFLDNGFHIGKCIKIGKQLFFLLHLVGGMNHSEISVVYDLIAKFNRHILIISSNIITPNIFSNYLLTDHENDKD